MTNGVRQNTWNTLSRSSDHQQFHSKLINNLFWVFQWCPNLKLGRHSPFLLSSLSTLTYVNGIPQTILINTRLPHYRKGNVSKWFKKGCLSIVNLRAFI